MKEKLTRIDRVGQLFDKVGHADEHDDDGKSDQLDGQFEAHILGDHLSAGEGEANQREAYQLEQRHYGDGAIFGAAALDEQHNWVLAHNNCFVFILFCSFIRFTKETTKREKIEEIREQIERH